MISNRAKHKEKSKLSDKFPQPFSQGPIGDQIRSFNAKNQKKKKKK